MCKAPLVVSSGGVELRLAVVLHGGECCFSCGGGSVERGLTLPDAG